MPRRRIVALSAGLLALSAVASSCSALKDPEPFSQQIVYSEGVSGQLVVQPLTLTGDTSFGLISVANETEEEHGFAINDLAVFEKIAAGKSFVVGVNEAKDDTTYEFYCQVHNEFKGTLIIDYVAEEKRR